MQKLNLPPADLTFRTENGKRQVFDVIRKKYVALTPEEWVRQHIIHYLAGVLKYPAGLMAVEALVKVNGMNQRADIVVYDKKGMPAMIVECKAPDVKVGNEVFEQAARYDIKLGVKYLFVSNGLKHFCARLNREEGSFSLLKSVPSVEDINK
jgi:type I site-specific restriction endonuclease